VSHLHTLCPPLPTATHVPRSILRPSCVDEPLAATEPHISDGHYDVVVVVVVVYVVLVLVIAVVFTVIAATIIIVF